MVEPNENFVIFLTLFVLSFSLPKFLLLFGAKLLFMLFMLLITFLVLSSKIKIHLSAFLGHLQTITTFTPLVLLVSFFFSHISITNFSLGLDFVIFLAMEKLKRDIGVMILSLIVFISPAMLSFGNITPLLSSLTFVPLSLSCLPIYLICLRSFSRWATYSFYSYSWSSYRLFFPTTRYFLCLSWITL